MIQHNDVLYYTVWRNKLTGRRTRAAVRDWRPLASSCGERIARHIWICSASGAIVPVNNKQTNLKLQSVEEVSECRTRSYT